MARDPKKALSRSHNTAGRRDFIDYDYLNQLSPEELEWLAKATGEYYGADFEINETFAKVTDVIQLCEAELAKDIEPRKAAKWQHNLERAKKSKSAYLQIYGNPARKDNLDLRKCRKIQLYYLNENGNLCRNKDFKYNTIHDFDEYSKDCNDRANDIRDDIHSVQTQSHQDANEYYLGIEATSELTPEEYWVMNDELEILEDCDELWED
jgi:hypothetical protein